MVQRLTGTAQLNHEYFPVYRDFAYERDAEDRRTNSTDICRLIRGLQPKLTAVNWSNPQSVLVRVDSSAEMDDGFWSLAALRDKLAEQRPLDASPCARIAGNLLRYDRPKTPKPRKLERPRMPEKFAAAEPQQVIKRTLSAKGSLSARTTSISVPRGSAPTTAFINFSSRSSSAVLEVISDDDHKLRTISVPQGKNHTRIFDLKPGVRYSFFMRGTDTELKAELSVAVHDTRAKRAETST